MAASRVCGRRAGIAVVLDAGIFARLLGFGIEKLDQTRAVVLADDVLDFVAQMVLRGEFRAFFDMRKQDEGAHGRSQLVVPVGAVELVFDVIVGIGQLADVVVQGRDLAQQAVRAHGLGSGLHHVGDDQRVVVGPREWPP